VAMILAVLTKHCDLKLGDYDIYTATVGGARLVEPSVDLAIAIATASAHRSQVLPTNLIAIGEVGLAGEVRKIGGIAGRLREAERIGFRHAIIPAGSDVDASAYGDLRITEVYDVPSALRVLNSPR
ncbi:MAG: DNA repair protein RadA, partial [Propionibacteriales bacterium]|nr:DNA repair protein RadA [Propionibacteriales bacterium]